MDVNYALQRSESAAYSETPACRRDWGRVLTRAGREALQNVRRAIGLATSNPDTVDPDELGDLVYVAGGPRLAKSAGHRPLVEPMPPERVAIMHALLLVNHGRKKTEVVRTATEVLASPGSADPETFWYGIMALIYAGEFAAADLHCRRAAQAYVRRDGQLMALVALLHARVAERSGRSREAIELLTGRARQPAGSPLLHLATAWTISALVDLGQLSRAETLLRERGLDGSLSAVADQAEVMAARGRLHLAAGRFDLAYDDFFACGQELDRWVVVNPSVIPWRSFAALSAQLTGRRWLAPTLAEEDLAGGRRWDDKWAIGFALRVSSRISQGETQVSLLREAEKMLAETDAKLDLVRAKYDLAVVLAQLEEQEATETAEVLLQQAREFAGSLENAIWDYRTARALTQLASSKKADQLTGQERAIADLAVSGHTDRHIADKLDLAPQTVEFHLSAIYRKLAIAGRRELSGAMQLSQGGRLTRIQSVIW
jgi:DNA-binding CsgD family transcriptional regulator